MCANTGDIPIIHTLYDAYAAWNQIIVKFPKSQRYALGETCSRYLLTTLELLLAAASTREPTEKIPKLKESSTKLDALKLLIRLSKDCGCVSNSHYLSFESILNEAGKMLGGWLKSITNKEECENSQRTGKALL